jgi:hypothetical protein
MKKFLLIFGYFILFPICFGTLFKLMHWPGAGPLLVLGISSFSMFFIPLFFIERMISNRKGLSIVTNIFAMLSTFMMFMGVLFKVMHWPGAGPLLVFGTVLFICPTLILYVIQQFKDTERTFSEYWRLVFASVLTCTFLFFYAIQPSISLLTTFLNVEDATLKTNKSLQASNTRMLAFVVYRADPAITAVATKINASTTKMVAYVEEIKRNLIIAVEHDPSTGAVDNHWLINSKDNYDIPTHMIGDEHSEMGIELYSKLLVFKKDMAEELKQLPFADKEKLISSLGDFGVNTEMNNTDFDQTYNTWQEYMFNQKTLAGTLCLLSSIQNELLNAEFTSLNLIWDKRSSGNE